MKKKIGFIAIGQAGGNIGRLFEERGFSVLYLNTSKEDLQTLKNVKHTYHIAGGDGCHKDRLTAKRLVAEDFENISREIQEKLNVPILYVIFSSGGGTGSGCGPMLIDLLAEEIAERTDGGLVGAITVIPDEKESVKAQINCYECFTELMAIDGIASTLAVDNAKGDKLSLNRQFVSAFMDFIAIPDQCRDERGNIDKAEIEEALRAKGMLVITKVPVRDNTTAAVLGSFRENIFAPIEPDRVIRYIALAAAGTVDVDAVYKEVGIPVDVFQTYSDKTTICCLSGLNYPKTRLETVYKKAVEHQELILKNMQATSAGKLKTDVNFLSAKAAEVTPPKPKTSRLELMRKYMGQ